MSSFLMENELKYSVICRHLGCHHNISDIYAIRNYYYYTLIFSDQLHYVKVVVEKIKIGILVSKIRAHVSGIISLAVIIIGHHFLCLDSTATEIFHPISFYCSHTSFQFSAAILSHLCQFTLASKSGESEKIRVKINHKIS